MNYTQLFKGIPIDRSDIAFSIGPGGDIYASDMNTFPEIDVPTSPAISKNEVVVMVKGLEQNNEVSEKDSDLLIYPEENDSGFVYHLAWKVWATSTEGTLIYYIDAINGSIIRVMNNTVYLKPRTSKSINSRTSTNPDSVK